jgi:hypothetical protein
MGQASSFSAEQQKGLRHVPETFLLRDAFDERRLQLFPNNNHFAGVAPIKSFISFACLFKREAMRDKLFRVQLPFDEFLDEFFHLPDGTDPRTVQRQLLVNEQRRGREFNSSAFANEDYPAPFARRFET